MLTMKAGTLRGEWVQLEPLTINHREELHLAAQDESIWTYCGSSAFAARFDAWFTQAIDRSKTHEHFAYVVRRLTDRKIIGSTRYYDISLEHHRLTIGYTWYVPEVWGTCVNPECKYLLLNNAFENLQVNRVEFTVDARNTRSRAAVKKLGATEEGILRRHMLLENGIHRDTVVYSIIKPEWDQLKQQLQQRLDRYIDV